MDQYPHTLTSENLGKIEYDEDGFPIVNSEENSAHNSGIPCREVPNNSGDFVNTEAGEKIVYGSKIYLPFGTDKIKALTEITVLDSDGSIRIKGRVIRFAKYQLNSVIWV